MNKTTTRFILGALVAGTIAACNMDYFRPDMAAGGSYKPTVAVPLAKVQVSVGQLLSQYESNIILTEDGDRSFLTLIYRDTLEALNLSDYAVAGVVPPELTIPMPSDRVDLRIFGDFEDGMFRLTNPRVMFEVFNTTSIPYELEFRDGDGNDFFTERKDGSNQRFLEITDVNHPYFITANDSTDFEFSNSNLIYTDDPTDTTALTQVMEPTPKYLNYGVDITTKGTTNDLSGELEVVGSVFLPLQGYGNIRHQDTTAYEFIENEQVDDLNFVELRFIINNGIPLQGKINEAFIVDTTRTPWTKIMSLPLYDENGNISSILIPAAEPGSQANGWKSTPVELLTDVILSRENMVQPVDMETGEDVGGKLNQIQALAMGNKVVLDIQVTSQGFDEDDHFNSNEVKIYSDQEMIIELGVKAQASIELGDYIPENQ